MQIGTSAFVGGCVALLLRQEVEPSLVIVLGGPAARSVLADLRPDQRYWLRVWAARGLLWSWDDRALPALTAALDDEAWRVREMASKVVARHLLGDALPGVVALRHDPVSRVRAAAARAVMRITDAGG